jgi:putative spermidine/putrescine transport system substrate-binding protein/spermidine/putrescine transport system substrate-binding protein
MRVFTGKLVALAVIAAFATPMAQADSKVLNIYNWSDYIGPNTIKDFEKETGIKVRYDVYDSNEVLQAKILTGRSGYDIVVPTGFAVQTLIGQKGAAPLDKAQLSNLKNINPGYMGGFFDKTNAYSVPYAFTTTVLGYNETQLQKAGVLDKANSWALIFDPAVVSKIKGKVTVLDSQRELMAAAMRYLGRSVQERDPARWEAAKRLILRAKPYWAAFSNSTQYQQCRSNLSRSSGGGWSGGSYGGYSSGGGGHK